MMSGYFFTYIKDVSYVKALKVAQDESYLYK